jgi:hypothetical protein
MDSTTGVKDLADTIIKAARAAARAELVEFADWLANERLDTPLTTHGLALLLAQFWQATKR